MSGHQPKTRQPENAIVNACMIALSEAGHVCWRNNTGVLPNAKSRPVHFGLCVGSSDIIGITKHGRFLAVECKTETGRLTDHQKHFIKTVQLWGGVAGVARTPEEAVKIAQSGHNHAAFQG